MKWVLAYQKQNRAGLAFKYECSAVALSHMRMLPGMMATVATVPSIPVCL